MTQHVLKGISVKAVPVKPGTCKGCVFNSADGASQCPSRVEELKAGFEGACYGANVIYVEVEHE